MLTRDGYCTKKIKMTIAKDTFTRKVSPLTGKLNIEIRKKLVRYCVWRALRCGAGGKWRI
jgi:hypothetical protein